MTVPSYLLYLLQEEVMSTIKCVLLGDTGCGKTSLALTYFLGKCPDHVPATFNSYTKNVGGTLLEVRDAPSNVAVLNQTSVGHSVFREVDAVLFCFSVNKPLSLENVLDYWWPVAKEHALCAKYFLVGCKADLLPGCGDLLTPLIRSPTMISVIQSISSLVTPTLRTPLPPIIGTDSDLKNSEQVYDITPRIISPDSTLPVGDDVVTKDLGSSMARQLGCISYKQCTVKDYIEWYDSVDSVFTQVVLKCKRPPVKSNKATSAVCNIL